VAVKRSDPRNALQPRTQTPADLIPAFAEIDRMPSEPESLNSRAPLLLSERFFVDYLLGYELAVIRGPTKFHAAILAEFLPFCEKDLGQTSAG